MPKPEQLKANGSQVPAPKPEQLKTNGSQVPAATRTKDVSKPEQLKTNGSQVPAATRTKDVPKPEQLKTNGSNVPAGTRIKEEPKSEQLKKNGSAGFALATSVQQTCKSITKQAEKRDHHLFKSDKHRFLYCPVEKIGTTFWRRVLVMLHNNNSKTYSNPYEVPIDSLEKTEKTLGTKLRVVRHLDPPEKEEPVAMEKFVKVLFTRDPYTRLVAGFIDKLVPPNGVFWDSLGTKAVTAFRKSPSQESLRHGHDVTFAEYARYVIKSLKTGDGIDGHSMPVFQKCIPCQFHYDFIGKLETFEEDAMYLIKTLGLNSSYNTFVKPKVFKEMATEDALNDTVFSGFSWKNQTKIITWETALKRIWLKLQMRGLVGLSERFETIIPKYEINSITAEEFRKRAILASSRSDPEELKRNKDEAMKEAYLTLHIDEVKYLRDLYMNDLKLFGYDEKPDLLFKRKPEPEAPKKYFVYYNWK